MNYAEFKNASSRFAFTSPITRYLRKYSVMLSLEGIFIVIRAFLAVAIKKFVYYLFPIVTAADPKTFEFPPTPPTFYR